MDELRFVLEDSNARVLIIDTQFLDRIGARSTSSGLRISTTDGADPEHQRLSEQSISHVLPALAMISFLLTQPANTDLDFSQLKLIAYGGTPITEPVLQAAMQPCSHATI